MKLATHLVEDPDQLLSFLSRMVSLAHDLPVGEPSLCISSCGDHDEDSRFIMLYAAFATSDRQKILAMIHLVWLDDDDPSLSGWNVIHHLTGPAR